jgi:tetratricopeptide (TPR) repeat protein
MLPVRNLRRESSANAVSVPATNHRSAGDAYRDSKKWAEAAAAYCRHLEEAPDDAAIWIQAGNCFKEAGNFAKSLTAYRKAEQLDPGNFEVHLQLGHLYKIRGDYAAALSAYERAALLNPAFGDLRHEIDNVSERLRSRPAILRNRLGFAASIDELLDILRNQSPEEDLFKLYFRSLGEATFQDRS